MFQKMQSGLVYLAALLMMNVPSQAYDQSLEACKLVAAEFRNTCAHGEFDTPATSMDTMSSETVTCVLDDESWPAWAWRILSFSSRCIEAATLSGTTCSWGRKLCVTCRDDNGVTKIRIQTNNLPDHCVSPSNTLVKAKNFDYEVNFNQKQTPGQLVNTFATQEQLDDAVCPIAKSYKRRSLGIVEYGDTESRNAAGFAINGVAFQFANQIAEDPAAPITESNEQPLDLCLGHNQKNCNSGMYHYHHVTPCLNQHFLDGKAASQDECANHEKCSEDKSHWSRSGYADMKYKKVIGLAKFGHVMYGPYNSSQELWGTDDVDACNGVWSSDGDFFYVATSWHPYLVGCQGPANHPQDDGLFPQCSTNGLGNATVSLISKHVARKKGSAPARFLGTSLMQMQTSSTETCEALSEHTVDEIS